MNPANEPLSLPATMRLVLLACVPGLLVLFWLHGWGLLLNLLLTTIAALLAEALMLRMQRRPVRASLEDGSAVVSATLLAIALPAYCPWWVPVTASSAALILGKHLYGGVGKNPFNPAMLGYALVLLSFPAALSQWPGSQPLGVAASLQQVFGLGPSVDAWAQATVLDVMRNNHSLTVDELFSSHPAFGHFAGRSSEWVGPAFLLGGLLLMQRKVYSWQAPLGMLGALFVASLIGWNGSGSDSHGSPLFHLLAGSTLFVAFFIVTEPVSSPKAPLARLLFGVGTGLLVYLIRIGGKYPDGSAFAVLLMNLAVPALERWAARRQVPRP